MSERMDMSGLYLDILQEVSNIGLGNAATALAELLSKKINISVPRTCFLDFEEVFHLVGGLEEVVSCVNLSFEGDISGTVMFIFTAGSTHKLIDMLVGLKSGAAVELDEMGRSVVMEVGNVLAGSFMNAIGNMTGLRMCTTVPMFAFDMLGAILSSSLVASGLWEDRVLVIETVFFQEQESIKGHFFLLPQTGALNKLFEALSIQVQS